MPLERRPRLGGGAGSIVTISVSALILAVLRFADHDAFDAGQVPPHLDRAESRLANQLGHRLRLSLSNLQSQRGSHFNRIATERTTALGGAGRDGVEAVGAGEQRLRGSHPVTSGGSEANRARRRRGGWRMKDDALKELTQARLQKKALNKRLANAPGSKRTYKKK